MGLRGDEKDLEGLKGQKKKECESQSRPACRG